MEALADVVQPPALRIAKPPHIWKFHFSRVYIILDRCNLHWSPSRLLGDKDHMVRLISLLTPFSAHVVLSTG